LLADISPEYDECPLVCFKREGNGKEFCDGCEVKVAKDLFKEEAAQALNDRFKDKWKVYDLDHLLESVIGIVNSEDDDKTTWSPTTEMLFDVYVGQRARLRRVDDWNLKQKLKNKPDGD